jgi:superfamily II DNA helicase RecQ
MPEFDDYYQSIRVVVDECHVVLDSGSDFRPKLRALGPPHCHPKTRGVFHAIQIPQHACTCSVGAPAVEISSIGCMDLTEGKSRVISSTNALGLGVDLPDI